MDALAISPCQRLWRNAFWPAVAIVLGGWFVFSPAFHGGWIWDDHLYIAQNPALRTVDGLRSIWLAPPGVNYFPLTFTIQWVQWQLWGEATTGYHLTNLGLHLLNCFLLWRVLARLGVRLPWLGGLLFAIHPLMVESVAWISELKNVLSLAFVLGALDAYLDFDERPRAAAYVRAGLFFLGAMLSKTTVVMFPAVLLLFCWWKRRRLRASDLGASLPFFIASAGLGLVTIWFEYHRAMSGSGATEDLAGRAAGAGTALVFYFLKSVVPVGLLPGYPRPPIDFPLLWTLGPWVVLIAAIAALAVIRRDWARHALLGIGWFVLNLLPILGFIPMAYLRIARTADHFAYLALPGVVGLAVAGFGQLAARLRPGFSRWFAAAMAAGICLLLAAVGRRAAGVFENEPTFWSTVLAHNPTSWLAHNHLGSIWLREGRWDSARSEFEAALKYAPDYVEAHNNLGLAFEGAGQLPEAIAEFRRALQLRPTDVAARANLAAAFTWQGSTWLSQNQPGRAVEAFAEALQIDPNGFAAHNNLGIALGRLGRLPEAIAHYETALRLKPDYPEALTNLGNALLRSGRPAEAAARYEAALRIAPDYAPARENLQYLLKLAPGASSAPAHPDPSNPR